MGFGYQSVMDSENIKSNISNQNLLRLYFWQWHIDCHQNISPQYIIYHWNWFAILFVHILKVTKIEYICQAMTSNIIITKGNMILQFTHGFFQILWWNITLNLFRNHLLINLILYYSVKKKNTQGEVGMFFP